MGGWLDRVNEWMDGKMDGGMDEGIDRWRNRGNELDGWRGRVVTHNTASSCQRERERDTHTHTHTHTHTLFPDILVLDKVLKRRPNHSQWGDNARVWDCTLGRL